MKLKSLAVTQGGADDDILYIKDLKVTVYATKSTDYSGEFTMTIRTKAVLMTNYMLNSATGGVIGSVLTTRWGLR